MSAARKRISDGIVSSRYMLAGVCIPNFPMVWMSQGCFLRATRCTNGASSPIEPAARVLRNLVAMITIVELTSDQPNSSSHGYS